MSKPKPINDLSYIIHDNERIHGFFLEYRWLSNFHSVLIKHEDINYPSTEHAYQAAKYPKDRRKEAYVMTCSQVRNWGQKGPINTLEWDKSKLKLMEALQRLKFTDPVLREKLIATKKKDLCELNHWMDNFYGCDYRTLDLGQNNLGKIIMKVRASLI